MKNHFFIGYSGNKRQEVDKIYNVIKDYIKDYNIIVEPFCGTCAFSYYFWLNNKDKKIKYILNDNNKFLYDLFITAKDENKLNELYKKLIKIFEETTNKDLYLKVVERAKTDLDAWIYINKICNIRAGLYPTTKKFNEQSLSSIINAPIIEFIRNADITFLNVDAVELYKNYKNDNKALIFLDPPYLASCNSFYKNPTTNIYEFLCDNDIANEKAFVVLCLENVWMIKLLFKGKKAIVYDKTYELSKKKTIHTIIINKK